MKKIMLAFSVLCISSLHAGVSVNTVVETSDGPKEIGVLQVGDKIILKKDHSFLGITSIRHKNESAQLRFIVVEENHNFLVSKNSVLIHNGAVGVAVGAAIGAGATTLAFNAAYGAVGVGVTSVAGPIAGAAVAGTVRTFFIPMQVAATKSATLICGLWGGIITGPV